MFFVIVILGFVAVAMAKKSPNEGAATAQALGPNENLPSTGATDKLSPAMTGGTPLIANDNQLRMRMVYQDTSTLRDRVSLTKPLKGTSVGIMGGLTDAQSSLPTQDVRALTTVIPDYSAKSNFVQRVKY